MAAEDENVVVGLNIQGYTFNLRGKKDDMPLYKETESRLNSRIQQEQRFKKDETVPVGTEKRIKAFGERLKALARSEPPAAPESAPADAAAAPSESQPTAPQDNAPGAAPSV